MASQNVVTLDNLGSGFDIGVAEPGKISIQFEAQTLPLYEWRDIWAEESSNLANGSSQWSFANGDTGYIGLPIDSGWEVVSMYFHSDNNGANDDLTVHMVDQSTPAANSPIVSTVTVVNSGQGSANNAYVFEEFATAIAVPDGAVLGFRTGVESGSFNGARVGARLRRKIGEYVSAVTVTNGVVAPVLGQPANGDLVSDNFQDGGSNSPFDLQVRNTTNAATNWQAVVTGPYTTIPNLAAGNYTLQTTDNGDGTYTHVFTGTTPLGAFGNITITGDAPIPAGSGGSANVGLYIP